MQCYLLLHGLIRKDWISDLVKVLGFKETNFIELNGHPR